LDPVVEDQGHRQRVAQCERDDHERREHGENAPNDADSEPIGEEAGDEEEHEHQKPVDCSVPLRGRS
jgi:hypothetical protein